MSSLIPEKPLLISPSLAATIGLEEACMLSLLSEVATYRQASGNWLELDEALISRLMPFWTDYDIQRISKNLKDKGIILLDSAPYTGSRMLRVAFNEGEANSSFQAPPITPPIASANLIAPNWQPDQELLRRVAEHNIR